MAIEVMDTDLEYVVGILEVSNRLSLAKIHNHPLKRHYYELAKEVFGRLSMPSELASDPLATRLIFSTVMQARELETELETRYFSDNSVEEPQQGANLIKAYCELLQYYQAIHTARNMKIALQQGLLKSPNHDFLFQLLAHIDSGWLRKEYPILGKVADFSDALANDIRDNWRLYLKK